MILVALTQLSENGLNEVIAIFQHRTSLGSTQHAISGSVSLFQLMVILIEDLFDNFGRLMPLLAQALFIGVVLRKRDSLILFSIAGFIVYSVFLRNHVGHHLFTRLPFIWLICCLFLTALFRVCMIKVIVPAQIPFRWSIFAALTITIVFYVFQMPQRFLFTPYIAKGSLKMEHFVKNNSKDLALCKTFQIEDPEKMGVDSSLVMMNMAPFYISALHKNSGPHCILDLQKWNLKTVVSENSFSP
jgi:hypothetical protein